MMRPHLTPENLQNDTQYELLEIVSYQNIKTFVLKSINKKSPLIIIYGIVQMMAILSAIITLAILLFHYFKNGNLNNELKWFVISIVFSFTALIPIHELIHAIAFLILGKKDIGFGIQLRKFIFYAEANRQVLNRTEMSIVAFAPIVVIGIVSIIIGVTTFNQSILFFCLGLFLIHFLFCFGDIAIVSFISRKNKIYTYDDRNEKKTYFYLKNESIKQ